jgi:hypothetical protein
MAAQPAPSILAADFAGRGDRIHVDVMARHILWAA